jgi:cbb3-type cytochrome oxidase maturation protein
MEIIFLLIPLSLVLVGGIVWAFFWAVRSGQFDDLEGPAHRILMDDDDVHVNRAIDKEDEKKAGEE